MQMRLTHLFCRFPLLLTIILILSGCSKAESAVNYFTPTPIETLFSFDEAEYSSYFTTEVETSEYSFRYPSEVGTIEYSLRYPSGWYVYPGSTKIAPGLGSETFIQSFPRTGDSNSGYQPSDSIKVEIYALPCAVTENGCDPNGLTFITENLQGTRTLQYLDGKTVWTVFLYTKNYRFMLQGYLKGEHDENSELIKILDEIASTVVIK